jgi:hypothetical protein
MEDYENLFQNLIKEGQQSGEIYKSFLSVAVVRHLLKWLTELMVAI